MLDCILNENVAILLLPLQVSSLPDHSFTL